MNMPRPRPRPDQVNLESDSQDKQFSRDLPAARRGSAQKGRPAGPHQESAEPRAAPDAWVRLSPAEPTEVYETYWSFAAERQEIFFRRLAGMPRPWTGDEILCRYRFTNTYRASDRVSQYLIRNIANQGSQEPKEIFFRTILFKLFNRIETWERLETAFGEITYKGYRLEKYDTVLTRAMEDGEKIYSAAYIMPSGPRRSPMRDLEPRKHTFHLRLLEQMIRDDLPQRLADLRSMREAFQCLRSYPSIGDFLAYQFVTDLNYTTLTDFSEHEFVVPGPGARDGIRKCFRSLGGLNEAEIIRLVMDRQAQEFERLGLRFQTLWGRSLQLIDCQNIFCEVDKYARVRHPEILGESGRTRIKRHFTPATEPRAVWYPPKWGLNERIAESPAGNVRYEIARQPLRPRSGAAE